MLMHVAEGSSIGHVVPDPAWVDRPGSRARSPNRGTNNCVCVCEVFFPGTVLISALADIPPGSFSSSSSTSSERSRLYRLIKELQISNFVLLKIWR